MYQWFRIIIATCMLCIMISIFSTVYKGRVNTININTGSAVLSYQMWNRKNLPQFLTVQGLRRVQNWTFSSDGKNMYDFNMTMEEMPALIEGWRRNRPTNTDPIDIMAMVSVSYECKRSRP